MSCRYCMVTIWAGFNATGSTAHLPLQVGLLQLQRLALCRDVGSLLLQLVHDILLLSLQLILEHLLLVSHLALLESQLLQLQGCMADLSHKGKIASRLLSVPIMTKIFFNS